MQFMVNMQCLLEAQALHAIKGISVKEWHKGHKDTEDHHAVIIAGKKILTSIHSSTTVVNVALTVARLVH